MAENRDYKVLLLTSDPETIGKVTEIGRNNFKNISVLSREFGNMSTKPDVLQQIEATEYNLIIRFEIQSNSVSAISREMPNVTTNNTVPSCAEPTYAPLPRPHSASCLPRGPG